MTGSALLALAPLMVLGLTSIVLLLLVAVWRNHAATAWLTAVGLVLTFLALWPAGSVGTKAVTPLLVVDPFVLFYTGLLVIAAIAVTAMTYGYLKSHALTREEYYPLLTLATLGAAVLVASTHFASLLLGLSILSISLYGLVSYTYSNVRAIEAGLKYLIVAAASTAFLIFGMALVYFEAGTMDLAGLRTVIQTGAMNPLRLWAGVSLVLVGLGLELGAAPFYQWTPDVYEGAPAPITAFIATVPKTAVFGLLVRYWSALDGQSHQNMAMVLSFMAVASMFVGNLLALCQRNLKRLLAYSSVAHVGYVFVGLVAAGALAVEAVTFYLVSYVLTNLGAFAVIAFLSNGKADLDDIVDYRGLAWQHPWLALALLAMLLSLAGLPLTAGFIGKYYLVTAGVGSALWTLVIVLIATSVMGLYYYIRVAVAVFAPVQTEAHPVAAPAPSLALAGAVALGALSISVVGLGVAPSSLIGLITSAIGPLNGH